MSGKDEGTALLLRVAAAIAPGVPVEPGHGAAPIHRDEDLLATMLAQGSPARRWRLWTNTRCLVTTRSRARDPRFATARAQAAALGWPVHVRGSGGSTVVHHAGVLNLSLLTVAPGPPPALDAVFAALVDPILAGLARLGLPCTTGPVPGSYCNGRFNICAAGRKIAGTACSIRPRATNHATLAHAALTVSGNPAADCAIVTGFDSQFDPACTYDEDSHTSVAQMLRDGMATGKMVSPAGFEPATY